MASLSELYAEDLLNFFTILTDYLKVIEYERSGARTNLMLLLMKYSSRNGLMHKIENIKEKLKENENNMKAYIKEMEQIQRDKSLKCPYCNGIGGQTKIKITVDDGVATPHMIMKPCPVCNGTGTLNLSEYLDRISLFIRISKNILRIEQIIYQMLQNTIGTFRKINISNIGYDRGDPESSEA